MMRISTLKVSNFQTDHDLHDACYLQRVISLISLKKIACFVVGVIRWGLFFFLLRIDLISCSFLFFPD